MKYEGLKHIFKENYLQNVSLSSYTSFKTGGIAENLVIITNEEELLGGMRYVKENDIELHLFGNCSNLLISDLGLGGVCFLITPEFSSYDINEEIIDAKAGILLSTLSRTAYQNSLSGLEFASGIPGSLGAGVAINAGAYDGEMSFVVFETRYIDEDLKIRTLDNVSHDFGYRHSCFSDSKRYILSSSLKLKKGRKEEIFYKMQEFKLRRKEKQPLDLPSAGSVFKRPKGYYAGKLIQNSGLMGYSIGGAQVSTLHAGFIVNMGNASSKDIFSLINHVKEKVFKDSGVLLETEIKILGDFNY